MGLPSLEAGHSAAPSPGSLAAGWALLTEAGAAIARLAALDTAPDALSPQGFALRAGAAGPARVMLAEQAIDDLAAVLHTGLAAIDAAARDGRDITAAANALWREFDHARRAMLELTSAHG